MPDGAAWQTSEVTLDATLIAAVRLARDAPALDVRIDGKPDAIGWISDSEHVTIERLRVPRQGVDEIRRTVDAGDGLMREHVRGNRSLVLQITCETSSQTLASTAEELADDLIAGLSRSDVLALLWVDRVGAPRCSDVRVTPYRDAHGDWRSAATFEAVFPWSRVHTPAATVTVDRIARVIGTGDVDPDDHVVALDVSEV